MLTFVYIGFISPFKDVYVNIFFLLLFCTIIQELKFFKQAQLFLSISLVRGKFERSERKFKTEKYR